VLHDLQPEESREQQHETDQHETAGDRDARTEASEFLLGVLEFHLSLTPQ
jgi:hypothetical protein